MKNASLVILLLSLVALIAPADINAQTTPIDFIEVIPQNATSGDSLFLIVATYLPSQPCEIIGETITETSGDFEVAICYVVGPLAAICQRTDTFLLGQASSGSHHVITQIQSTWDTADVNCLNSISPIFRDTTTFDVQITNGIGRNSIGDLPWKINQTKQEIRIMGDTPFLHGTRIFLSNMAGQTLLQAQPNRMTFDISKLSQGLYLISIIEERKGVQTFKFFKP